MPDIAASLGLLSSPAILFFFVGAAAAFARSDLSIPEQVAKAISLYLMLCIGFRGGVEAREAGLQGDFLTAGALGLALSTLLPLLAFILLRWTSRLEASHSLGGGVSSPRGLTPRCARRCRAAFSRERKAAAPCLRSDSARRARRAPCWAAKPKARWAAAMLPDRCR